MNKPYGVAFRLGAMMLAGGSLTGCVAQVLHSAIRAGVEASSTPESVGVSTSTWRGKSCKDLEFSYGFMAEDQRKSVASGDSFSAKTSGWQMDAINQVRTEQGCIAGAAGVKVPANGQVTAYGYCLGGDDRHQYLTPVFTYGDYYADSGADESAAFSAMLKSTYGFTGNGVCVMEDSPTKAQAEIERTASLTNLQLNRDTVRVAWTPPPMVKAPKASVAATSATVPGKTTTTTPIASSNSAVTHSAVTAPLAVQVPIAEPAKPKSTLNYCYAYLTVGEVGGSTCSPVIGINDIDGSRSVFQTRLNSFVEKVKQSQPGIWGEFEYSNTIMIYNGFIDQMKPKAGFEATKQHAGLICNIFQTDADASLKNLKKNDSSLKIVGWP